MIKFNYSLNEIGAIIGIDLAMYHTGMSVYDVHLSYLWKNYGGARTLT